MQMGFRPSPFLNCQKGCWGGGFSRSIQTRKPSLWKFSYSVSNSVSAFLAWLGKRKWNTNNRAGRNRSTFMLVLAPVWKFHFREGRRTMILSVLSSPALVSGLMVARAKNPVHSVLFPILVFCDTSGLLLLLGLDFSAMIFPVVHIGAIAVSFLFVVMMFHIQIAEIHEEVLRYLPVSGIIGLILWWEMFFILDNETIPLLPTQRNTTSLRYTVYAGKVRSWTNLETLGNLLYTYYFVWFLVPSLILLVAMIGAIVLTMHRTTKVKRQDVFRRNAMDFRRTIMRRTRDPSQSTKGKVAPMGKYWFKPNLWVGLLSEEKKDGWLRFTLSCAFKLLTKNKGKDSGCATSFWSRKSLLMDVRSHSHGKRLLPRHGAVSDHMHELRRTCHLRHRATNPAEVDRKFPAWQRGTLAA